MQVHTPTGHRADWGIEYDRDVALRVALDLTDRREHLVGVVEPMGEQSALAERWAAA